MIGHYDQKNSLYMMNNILFIQANQTIDTLRRTTRLSRNMKYIELWH